MFIFFSHSASAETVKSSNKVKHMVKYFDEKEIKYAFVRFMHIREIHQDKIILLQGDIIYFREITGAYFTYIRPLTNVLRLLIHRLEGHYIGSNLRLKDIPFLDKEMQYSLFDAIKIPFPKTRYCFVSQDIGDTQNRIIKIINNDFAGEAILKIPTLNNGEGVFLASGKEFHSEIIQKSEVGDIIILQERIPFVSGVDLRVVVLNSKIHFMFERRAPSGFKSNISQGGKTKVVELDELSSYTQKNIGHIVDLFSIHTDFVYYCIDLMIPSEGSRKGNAFVSEINLIGDHVIKQNTKTTFHLTQKILHTFYGI